MYLGQIFLFALGSALCGAATSLNFLIAGRGSYKNPRIRFVIDVPPLVVQGLGAGGIAASTQIIISDLVPLQERGPYNGLIAM